MISLANQIEIRHLQYFRALAEDLHYRKAAERLFISQSALSQQIKQLEALLRSPLFERTNKKVILTNAGKQFYGDVVQLLSRLETSVGNLELLKKGNTGQIGIGFVASAMHSILPGLLQKFNHAHPDIKFQLQELTNKEQLAALQKDELDLAFIRSNQVENGMQIKSILKETFSLILPASHPMTARKFRNIGQLKEEPFILYPNDQSQLYYQQIINLCADHGFTPIISHKAIHAPAVFKLVEIGMGLSIIPSSLAVNAGPAIRSIELKNIPQKTELFAVWKKDSTNPALPPLLKML